MTRLRLGTLFLAAAGLIAACGTSGGSTGIAAPIKSGGTLRVVDPVVPFLADQSYPLSTTLDPIGNWADTSEYFRCCLGRTLLSFNGQPTAKGGSTPKPDLATQLPDVAADGLTWTFHIKQGLHYAPPLQATEITTADIIRALSRGARLSGTPLTVYSVIQGWDDFAQKKTTTIAGLQAPDPHTLIVRLTVPTGDLGYRLSLDSAAPLPPLPGDPSTPYGVATGHDDGASAFMVSSGPYMVEGAGAIDFRLHATTQKPASGFAPGKSITLVRNPSWQAATDDLRPAYADRIVITFPKDLAAAAQEIDSGAADLLLTLNPAPQAPADQITAYRNNASLGHVEINPAANIRYLSMNLAMPPFDDLHVRRAIAIAVDRQATQSAFGGPLSGAVIGHLVPDSLEGNALLTYDPYRADNAQSRLTKARAEMALSRYDPVHTGMCTAPVCREIPALNIADKNHAAAPGRVLADNLAQIGIVVDLRDTPAKAFFTQAGDPSAMTPMAIGWGWTADWPSGAGFFSPLFTGAGFDAAFNYSLLGASPEQLKKWGYGVGNVPSVDDRVRQCVPEIGDAQARCWAALDQYLMEAVVPSVAIKEEICVEVVPARITAFSFDQAFGLPALDRVGVSTG